MSMNAILHERLTDMSCGVLLENIIRFSSVDVAKAALISLRDAAVRDGWQETGREWTEDGSVSVYLVYLLGNDADMHLDLFIRPVSHV